MNNQPSAEDLLNSTQLILNRIISREKMDGILIYHVSDLRIEIDRFLNSEEVSAAVTPTLEWDQATQKTAEIHGYEHFTDLVGSAVERYDTKEVLKVCQEAAQLMSSNRDHALANFIENHATQIISPIK